MVYPQNSIKVLALTIGDINRASSRLRVFNVFNELQIYDNEKVVILSRHRSILSNRIFNFILNYFVFYLKICFYLIFQINKSSVVYVQECVLPNYLIFFLKKRSKRIIFDFSDPLDVILGKYKRKTSILSQLSISKFYKGLRLYHNVIVENPNYIKLLRKHCFNIKCISGPVSKDYFAPYRRVGKIITIGWIGSPGTFHFVEKLINKICLNITQNNLRIVLMGCNKSYRNSDPRVNIVKWSLDSESKTYKIIDIGLLWLPTQKINKYRGAGKLFMYLAANTSVLSTNFGIAKETLKNTQLQHNLLPNDYSVWINTILSKINNVSAIDKEKRIGGDLCRKHYSIQENKDFYKKVLK